VDKALEQFFTAAKQIADVAHFDSVQVGSVVTDSRPRTIIALSARLIRSGSAPALLSPLQVAGLSAQQYRLPLEKLSTLLEEFSSTWPEQIHDQEGWRYTSKDWDDTSSFVCSVSSRGPVLTGALPSIALNDTLIAEASQYAYASLSRVIKSFTGLAIDHRPSAYERTRAELMAPWPVRSLDALWQGDFIRVTVTGLSGLDPSRFILNVEGTQTDKKFDAAHLRWQAVATAGKEQSEYTASCDVRDIGPRAVNLYIQKAPEIHFRMEISSQPQHGPQRYTATVFGPRVSLPVQPTASPEGARLTRLQVSGLRLLQSVELDLTHPFAVVVGPNQSGKSSLLEALQILADSAKGELSEALVRRRGGLNSLLTRGGQSQAILFEASLDAPGSPALRYRLSVSPVGTYDFTVAEETLSQQVNGEWALLLARQGSAATLAGVALAVPNERESMVSQLGLAHPVVEAVRASLSAIAVYPYFRTGAAWAEPESASMRRPVRLEPGARLDRSGDNLAAALFSLRDERPSDWEEYLAITRLAFPNLKDLRMPAVSRGTVQLFWDDLSGQSFDASELSDGTLSFLSILCALFQPGSALIAVDEPEQHLHPDALRRLVGAARALSDRQPILLTTQSDVLVGFLDETPESVAVANRGPEGATLVRPDLAQLQEWLKTFSLRELRRELEGWSQEP
jgi:predicted ATPase